MPYCFVRIITDLILQVRIGSSGKLVNSAAIKWQKELHPLWSNLKAVLLATLLLCLTTALAFKDHPINFKTQFSLLYHILHSLRRLLLTPGGKKGQTFLKDNEHHQVVSKRVQRKFWNLSINLFPNKTAASLIKAWQSLYRFLETGIGKCGLSH